jgi:hypothetical protein
MMRKITTFAALLTAFGGGAALAQGAPPGFVPWHSGWLGSAESRPGQAMSAPMPGTTRSDSRDMTARNNGSVPVAGKAPSTYRKS